MLLLVWYVSACAAYAYEPTRLDPEQAVIDQKYVMVSVRTGADTTRRPGGCSTGASIINRFAQTPWQRPT